MIEIESVSKAYGDVRVLDDVSLTIPTGGITSLIGANGAGKSTLLSIAARLLSADRGRVQVDGMDVATTPGEVLARRLAVLRQENAMSVRLTVRELVAFGRFPHSGGRLTAEDHRLVAEGPTADLMTPELLREVFDVEVEVHELAGRRIGVPWS